MKVVAIVQARMGSKRLPKKSLIDISGKPMLWHIIDRLRRCRNVADVIVATSTKRNNDEIESFCCENEVACFRGSEEDVLSRFYYCAKENSADHVVRITADNPFIDPKNIDLMVNFHIKSHADLTYTVNMPLGTGPGNEVISFSALKKSFFEANAPEFREHADEYIIHNMNLFKVMSIDCTLKKKHPEFRLTVDDKRDLRLTREIYRRLYKKGKIVSLDEAVRLLEKEPSLNAINRSVVQKKVRVA